MKKITPLLFLFLTMSSITFAQISDIEKNALLDLYNSTNGKDWNNTWNVSESAENWQGITISNNAVTEINLSMNNLEGVLPASIGDLKSLTHLNLGFNNIKGEIPVEICDSKNLESIQLFMNQITGELPSNIGNLVNLKELVLFNNFLTVLYQIQFMILKI